MMYLFHAPDGAMMECVYLHSWVAAILIQRHWRKFIRSGKKSTRDRHSYLKRVTFRFVRSERIHLTAEENERGEQTKERDEKKSGMFGVMREAVRQKTRMRSETEASPPVNLPGIPIPKKSSSSENLTEVELIPHNHKLTSLEKSLSKASISERLVVSVTRQQEE
jgi:hypothetical protein